MLINRATISLEEEAGSQREIELTTYGKVDNFDMLKLATNVERQFQFVMYEQSDVATGNVRIRCTNDDDYKLTIKYKPNTDNAPGKNEICKPIDKEAFDAFSWIAQSGMYKDRYYYPVVDTDLVWEVDFFIQADGSYAPWVKFDLELKEGQSIPPGLKYPFETLEIINRDNKEVLDKVYDDYLIVKPGVTTSDFKTESIASIKERFGFK